MSVLTVPADRGSGYPTLGPLVVDWMHENLVFGPGDLLGEPLELDAEQQGFIWSFYELEPRRHPEAGRRRFKRCALSLAKGLRKTELAALVAIAELHPEAPVRFAGWDRRGRPKGRGVTDPMVILCAYTEEQSDDLCFGAMRQIILESRIAAQFDVGLERVMIVNGHGKAISVAGSPSARDGARTTFEVFDETHHYTLPRLKRAHATMLANLPKRKLSDAWSLEITTAPEPGVGSVAEATMDYARAVAAGKVKDTRLFFFHRQASDKHDLTTEKGARAAVIEASGKAASWRDIDAIMALWADPTTDRSYWERVWTNRLVQASLQAFDAELWRSLATESSPVSDGDLIALGFDGALFRDSTALVATHVETGYQWLAGVWEAPYGHADWQVPEQEVDDLIDAMFRRYDVWRLYADPPYWQSWIARWSSKYGPERIIEWWTNRRTQMTHALENFDTAMRQGALSHDGDETLLAHIANARRHELPQLDAEGKHAWLIRKERSDSPLKIDAAMAAVLSWEARTDAVRAGVLEESGWIPVTRAGIRATDPVKSAGAADREREAAKPDPFIPMGVMR